MKWHVICLAITMLLTVRPITAANLSQADHERSRPALVVSASASHSDIQGLLPWACWSAVVWAYGACPDRATLCCWPLMPRWRPTRPGGRGKRQVKSGTPAAVGQTSAPAVAERKMSGKSPVVSAGSGRVPLRLVLRPGVLLTQRGIQLRPMSARLGQDVEAYRMLWQDREQFKAAIEPLLGSSCPLCDGQTGFRCVGSDKRSVIPPGSKDRVWFRVQKVECRDCGAGTRILPTFCIPFKSHHAQTIQNALENCWRRNTSYRDTTGILNQSRPADGQYRGHTLPYEWTIWLGGLAIHLPQLLVWLGLQLPRHGLLDEYFMNQDKGTDDRRIFALTLQDPESTAIWNIVRVDSNNTAAFKQTRQELKAVRVRLRAITSDGWPAILRAVREELEDTIHLLCYFHAKKNVFETLEKYRTAKKLPEDAPELLEWRRAFFAVLDAPSPKLYRVRLRKLTKQVADEPLLLARCQSLQKKSHYNTHRLRSPLLAATTSRVELSFKFLTRKAESLYSFRRSRCNAAQKSLTVWALVRNFIPYLPGAQYAGQSPAELAGVDLEGLPWLQYVNLKLSEVD
jgi:hypothetical protein